MPTFETRSRKASKWKTLCVLLVAPLLVPLGLLVSPLFRPSPVLAPAPDAVVLVSRKNPFASYAGPVYLERLSSSRPPLKFWEQMQDVFKRMPQVTVEREPQLMGPNYSESRDHHQASFKVLNVPQIALSNPRYHSDGTLKNAHFKIYLWSDDHGGSFMELWIMDSF